MFLVTDEDRPRIYRDLKYKHQNVSKIFGLINAQPFTRFQNLIKTDVHSINRIRWISPQSTPQISVITASLSHSLSPVSILWRPPWPQQKVPQPPQHRSLLF